MSDSLDDVPATVVFTRRRAFVLFGLAVGAGACRNERAATLPTNPTSEPTALSTVPITIPTTTTPATSPGTAGAPTSSAVNVASGAGSEAGSFHFVV